MVIGMVLVCIVGVAIGVTLTSAVAAKKIDGTMYTDEEVKELQSSFKKLVHEHRIQMYKVEHLEGQIKCKDAIITQLRREQGDSSGKKGNSKGQDTKRE